MANCCGVDSNVHAVADADLEVRALKYYESRSPDVEAIVRLLDKREIRYVLNGSVATLVFGVDLTPGDIDVVPALDHDNLARLTGILAEIEATPPPHSFGSWTTGSDGERKWVPSPDPEAALASWRPDPADVTSLDYLFHSRLGNFDIVPQLTGTYEDLMPLTIAWDYHGIKINVVRPEILLETLTVPRREKDRPRVLGLRQVQREILHQTNT